MKYAFVNMFLKLIIKLDQRHQTSFKIKRH